jgi:small-conductance mechanosensitive channel
MVVWKMKIFKKRGRRIKVKLAIQKGLKQVLALFVAFFTIIHTFLSIFCTFLAFFGPFWAFT